MRSNIDCVYEIHNNFKLCDVVNITLLKNAYIAYTYKANTNLLRKFVKRTYTYTKHRYAFVIPKYRLNNIIHAVYNIFLVIISIQISQPQRLLYLPWGLHESDTIPYHTIQI